MTRRAQRRLSATPSQSLGIKSSRARSETRSRIICEIEIRRPSEAIMKRSLTGSLALGVLERIEPGVHAQRPIDDAERDDLLAVRIPVDSAAVPLTRPAFREDPATVGAKRRSRRDGRRAGPGLIGAQRRGMVTGCWSPVCSLPPCSCHSFFVRTRPAARSRARCVRAGRRSRPPSPARQWNHATPLWAPAS